MENCKKIQFKGDINNNNLELFDALVFEITVTIPSGSSRLDFFQCAAVQGEGKSVKVTLLEGDDIFVKDNNTRISAGNSYNTTSAFGYYYATSDGTRKIKIERLYNVKSFQALPSGLTLENIKRMLNLVAIQPSYAKINNSNTSYGNVEPVVEYRAKYRETLADYIINGCLQNCVKIHNRVYNASEGKIYCEDTSTVVNVRNRDISGTLLATYTKATGEWTYNY